MSMQLPTILRAARSLALTGMLMAFGLGCQYEDRPHGKSGTHFGNPPKKEITLATIDTGATLASIEPGKGVGVFVEYQAGGTWRVTTACDTEISDAPCVFDIIVATEKTSQLIDFAPEELESSDYLDWEASNAVRMVNDNSFGLDGMQVTTEPGATLRVDVFLDDNPEPRFIYWVGNGGLHRGAPTNPIDLSPSAP